ncbi:MAG TPA: PASTA domain-containing protein [Candidatus Dormibacteraeota bacterium]|nr:PASTA domain-containing protein [Candidatus Dormibacteraeota bacterium]
MTTGAKVAGCSSGTTCTGSVSEGSPTRDLLIAYVSAFASTLPPSNIRATSDQVPVTWVPSTAVVPSLIGMSESAATDLITASNLVPSVSHQKTCTDPGDVLNQNPSGGTVVPIGSTVHITVDSGTPSTCIIK